MSKGSVRRPENTQAIAANWPFDKERETMGVREAIQDLDYVVPTVEDDAEIDEVLNVLRIQAEQGYAAHEEDIERIRAYIGNLRRGRGA